MSRQPIRITPLADGALAIDAGLSPTLLEVDGVALEESLTLQPERLDAGVVFELAQRIVLLLHTSGLTIPSELGDYGLVGESEGMLQVRADIERVADLDVPVLLRGETGTGKELVARAIHRASRRRGRDCLCVNVGAIPPALAASELFGSAKGAFTGSVQTTAGYFERAEGGTLFLDEVGETPAEVQVALLRVLENGEIQRVGSQQPQKVDVRLIAATDVDLEASIASGRFKAPLLHRLCGYEIALPPLRLRRDDFGRLLFHFLRQELRQLGEEERIEQPTRREDPWLPASVVARLARHDWPGNVRQLRNVVRQLVIGSRGAPRLTIGPQVERMLQQTAVRRERPEKPPPLPRRSPHRSPSDVGDDELLAALKANRFKLKPTARSLGVARSSLYMLIDRHPSIRKASELAGDEIERCREQCGGDLEAMADRLEVSSAGLRQRLRELKTEGD